MAASAAAAAMAVMVGGTAVAAEPGMAVATAVAVRAAWRGSATARLRAGAGWRSLLLLTLQASADGWGGSSRSGDATKPMCRQSAAAVPAMRAVPKVRLTAARAVGVAGEEAEQLEEAAFTRRALLTHHSASEARVQFVVGCGSVLSLAALPIAAAAVAATAALAAIDGEEEKGGLGNNDPVVVVVAAAATAMSPQQQPRKCATLKESSIAI